MRDPATCPRCRSHALISAVGVLNQPKVPDFKGLNKYRGETIHSAEWHSGVEYRGKRVNIIGTGASAYQIAPNIVDEVESLTIFQRSAPWILPAPLYRGGSRAGSAMAHGEHSDLSSVAAAVGILALHNWQVRADQGGSRIGPPLSRFRSRTSVSAMPWPVTSGASTPGTSTSSMRSSRRIPLVSNECCATTAYGPGRFSSRRRHW